MRCDLHVDGLRQRGRDRGRGVRRRPDGLAHLRRELHARRLRRRRHDAVGGRGVRRRERAERRRVRRQLHAHGMRQRYRDGRRAMRRRSFGLGDLRWRLHPAGLWRRRAQRGGVRGMRRRERGALGRLLGGLPTAGAVCRDARAVLSRRREGDVRRERAFRGPRAVEAQAGPRDDRHDPRGVRQSGAGREPRRDLPLRRRWDAACGRSPCRGAG